MTTLKPSSPVHCLLAIASVLCAAEQTRAEEKPRPPNIVIIYADDLGYGDLGCYGNRTIRTPNLDRMAKEGVRFTDFYVAQAVCSASRTALLTGCYPNRVGILGALNPSSRIGISARETTLAEMLKAHGYATAIYGKWHLGHHPQFLPTRHGFDDYYGLPYSNDMWPQHPTQKFPPLPLIAGDKVIQTNPDQSMLTQAYTKHAVDFIARGKDRPFFLYVPHTMPHVPIFASEGRKGKSRGGVYGDVIEELDASVGQILAAIKEHGLDEQTLVMFASDNGPWLSYGNHAGTAGPLREGKATTFEGGVREPFIARWPGHIPAGRVCKEPAMTIDLLPTIARLTGAKLPANRIDGKDITPLLTEDKARSPHESLVFYWNTELQALRSGKWKLHFPHTYPHVVEAGKDGKPGQLRTAKIERSLFDLEQDIGEKTNVAEAHPDVVRRLEELADAWRKDLGDSARKMTGAGVRPPGKIDD